VEGEIGPGAGTVEEEFDHGVFLTAVALSARLAVNLRLYRRH
jgi:hypothetical protein